MQEHVSDLSAKPARLCNGKACSNKVPGPGAKGTGTVAIQNYDAWQKICINMDTICENKPVGHQLLNCLDRHSDIRSLQDR